MALASHGSKAALLAAMIAWQAAGAPPSQAAAPETPVAGKQVRFPRGTWSAVPQAGPDGKVRQCVLVALRSRAGRDGAIDTHFSLIISRGAGLGIGIEDAEVLPEQILDDQAEIVLDGGRSIPAVGFTVTANNFAFHPGDAAAVLAALENATTLTLRSAGAGIDTGAIELDLPGDALGWLQQCGQTFDIAIDRPTDPNAPPLPAPRPRSPELASGQPTAAGPAGIEDKQKIGNWDASELRTADGRVAVCMIRQHYFTGKEPGARSFATFLMVSRARGLTMMLKDSSLNLTAGQKIEATLKVGNTPFTGFSAQAVSADEIILYPQHGAALAQLLESGNRFDFKAPKVIGIEGPVPIVAWARACARRHGIAFEPGAK
jgi:hypothetical protein